MKGFADLPVRNIVPCGISAEPQTNVKLKYYRREPLEWFSTMSQSPKTNCWGWLNSLHFSTEGFRKLQFSCLRKSKNQLPSQIQKLFMLKANSDRRYPLRNSDFNLPHFNTILWPRNLQRNYVLRIVCAVLRLKLGEQTGLP